MAKGAAAKSASARTKAKDAAYRALHAETQANELITGYAGKSTCLMTITFPFIENKPVFTVGDHGGRTFMRLQDDELLVCFPYRLVPGLITNLGRTVYAQGHE